MHGIAADDYYFPRPEKNSSTQGQSSRDVDETAAAGETGNCRQWSDDDDDEDESAELCRVACNWRWTLETVCNSNNSVCSAAVAWRECTHTHWHTISTSIDDNDCLWTSTCSADSRKVATLVRSVKASFHFLKYEMWGSLMRRGWS